MYDTTILNINFKSCTEDLGLGVWDIIGVRIFGLVGEKIGNTPDFGRIEDHLQDEILWNLANETV